MHAAHDISEFLTSRRARLSPEHAGLPSYGRRRVPGLRFVLLNLAAQDFFLDWDGVAGDAVQHPIVGALELAYEAMDLAADAGLTVVTYSAEPGSRSEEGLNLLASWIATSGGEYAAAPETRSH